MPVSMNTLTSSDNFGWILIHNNEMRKWKKSNSELNRWTSACCQWKIKNYNTTTFI